ncbi:MAG: DUF6020 family protein [Oscillospiraceae bacterium]|nr:DUF6020 family protein [Oscillospiraceae bacterium]
MGKNKTARSVLEICLAAVCSILLAFLEIRYFRVPVLWLPLAAVVLFLLLRYLRKIHGKRLFICNAVFSLLLALAFVAGGKADAKDEKDLAPLYHSDFLYFAALAVIFFICFSCLSDFLRRHPVTLREEVCRHPKLVWLLSALVLFLCWIPCLLIFYPGNVTGDSVACISGALGKVPLSNQQPVFYILLIRLVLHFALAIGKSVTFGVALFLALQTLVAAFAIGYFFSWLVKNGFPKIAFLLCAVYFIANPLFSVYAVTMWKDIFFGDFMLVYLTLLYDCIHSKGEKLKRPGFLAGFLAVNLLLCFLRNNGYYIVFLTLIVLAVLYRKLWKRVVPAFLALLVLVPVIQGPVYKAANIKESPFAESVAIPLQQIGYTVVKNGKMTAEQKAFVDQLLPLETIKQVYMPRTADKIKFDKGFNNAFLEKNKVQFIKVWAGMLVPNLKYYIKAYIGETLGYWHIGTTNWVALYGTVDKASCRGVGVVEADIPGFSQLRGIVEGAMSVLQYNIPVLSLLLSIGFLFWVAAYAAFQMIVQKRKKQLISLLPLFLLWLTLMVATPTFCEFRYMFAYATAFPLIVLLAFPQKLAKKGALPKTPQNYTKRE